jgi:hypothetical protein
MCVNKYYYRVGRIASDNCKSPEGPRDYTPCRSYQGLLGEYGYGRENVD